MKSWKEDVNKGVCRTWSFGGETRCDVTLGEDLGLEGVGKEGLGGGGLAGSNMIRNPGVACRGISSGRLGNGGLIRYRGWSEPGFISPNLIFPRHAR